MVKNNHYHYIFQKCKIIVSLMIRRKFRFWPFLLKIWNWIFNTLLIFIESNKALTWLKQVDRCQKLSISFPCSDPRKVISLFKKNIQYNSFDTALTIDQHLMNNTKTPLHSWQVVPLILKIFCTRKHSFPELSKLVNPSKFIHINK